jgi:hypothetical protein
VKSEACLSETVTKTVTGQDGEREGEKLPPDSYCAPGGT